MRGDYVLHACPKCGSKQLKPWQTECHHRRACEARQMLNAGASPTEAAAHAQRLKQPDTERADTLTP